ncbi:beta-galactoside-binding lectin-like [Synchiropus splendidus]|uniref:beta-galactoside-binding lectin-like n=1 Tax=Synchiropus splendidus TaxID=270530 RepID=UPI00237E9F69|nr:beta-galactoside-binding lectin-like [Synchiropus splendidus]
MAVLKTNNMPLKVGQTLSVTGIPDADATTRFAVNIGPDDKDIALHVNPRFKANVHEHTVVFNTRQGGTWGQEVLGEGFPFQQGVEFTITIAFNPEEFVVTFSDGSVIHFPNRLGAKEYTYFFADGEVRIVSLDIKQ